MQAGKVTPEEVAQTLGTKYFITREGAQVLIEFHEAKTQRDHKVHGAERRFDRVREELGKYFPEPLERMDVLDDFERLYA